MSILSNFTDNRKAKITATVAQLGKPEEMRVYDSSARGKLCTFFCGLGLPYMPLNISVLQTAYHAMAKTGDELLDGKSGLIEREREQKNG